MDIIPHCIYQAGTDHCSKKTQTTTWRRGESGQWGLNHTVFTMLELTTVLTNSDHQLEERGIWTVDIIPHCIYQAGTDHCSKKTQTTSWRRGESGQWGIHHTVFTMLELTTVLKKLRPPAGGEGNLDSGRYKCIYHLLALTTATHSWTGA